MTDLCQLLEKATIFWDGMMQAQGLDYLLAQKVARSGCKHVFIGIESFHLDFLKRLNKIGPSTNGEIAIKALAKSGVDVSIGLIIAGPPFQTRQEFEHDLRIIANISSCIKSVALNHLCIPKGTRLWQISNQIGIKGLDGPKAWKFWHSGGYLHEIKQRFDWCAEAASVLKNNGISLGANYEDFSSYAENQMCEAEEYFQRMF